MTRDAYDLDVYGPAVRRYREIAQERSGAVATSQGRDPGALDMALPSSAARAIPDLAWDRLSASTLTAADFVHTHFYKTHGAHDLRSEAWPEVRDWYAEIVIAGAAIAFLAIGKDAYRYDFARPDVLDAVHAQVIRSSPTLLPHTRLACELLFDEESAPLTIEAQVVAQQIAQLLESGLGKPEQTSVQVATVLMRLFTHGYLGCFIAAQGHGTVSGNESRPTPAPGSDSSGTVRESRGGCLGLLALPIAGVIGSTLLATGAMAAAPRRCADRSDVPRTAAPSSVLREQPELRASRHGDPPR